MKKLAYIFGIYILSINLMAQNDSIKEFKVGLVLSGGGAKGFAHIGVLKAIEEAGVTIDYIGGTSMGSIVGAMFASGYSATEIEEIILKLGFENYLEKEILRPDKPFYQKENDDKFAVKLPVVNKKISFPSGWTNGLHVMNSLSKYLQHVSNVTDFNLLPIPFLCVATDLETGKQVLLNKGNLAEAIRASAAFPTVVKPIEIEGKWLVDGGLVNNFPVKEVKNMGADFIIGVEVSSNKLYEKDELQSIVKIMEQMVSYRMISEENNSKNEHANIFIHPLDEDRFTTFSFDKAKEIIQFGYDTALLQIDSLKALGNKQAQFEKPKTPKNKIEILDKFVVKSIQITGNKHYSYGYIIEKMQIRLKKIISFEELFLGINRLWATNNFGHIQHRVVLEKDKGTIFINVTESEINTYVQIGVQYDPLFNAGVLLNWTQKKVLLGNDFFSSDIIIGENFRYNLNYTVDNGIHLSLGLQSVLENFSFSTEFDNNFSTFKPEMNYKLLRLSNVSNKLNFQYVYHDNFAWGFGIEHQYHNVKDNSSLALIKTFENSHSGSLYTYLKFDNYDNRMFPKHGFYMDLSGKWQIISKSNWTEFKPFLQGKVVIGYAIPLSKKFTTHIQSEAGLSFSENTNPFLDFHIGGENDNYLNNFSSFYGYPFAGMGNSSYLKTALNFRYEWMKNHYLGMAGNVARTDDNFLRNLYLFEDIKKGFSFYYGINSIAGPIQIMYARSPELKNNIFSVKLGYWF